MSCVPCHVSCVKYHIFFLQNGGISQWRVCYQRDLRRQVLIVINLDEEILTSILLCLKDQDICLLYFYEYPFCHGQEPKDWP